MKKKPCPLCRELECKKSICNYILTNYGFYEREGKVATLKVMPLGFTKYEAKIK
jgi:hypothetical protein